MAPLPVIADVFRVALEWQGASPDAPVNVMHIKAPGATEADVASAWEAALQPSQWDVISDAFSLSHLAITKLDGVSAQQNVPISSFTGGASGQVIPEQSMIISIHTSVRGPRGRGRLFLGPTTEAMVDHGVWSIGVPASVQTIWADFANALIAGTPSMSLGVASYVHSDWNQASTITCPQVVGIQARRLRRLRP